MALTLEYAVAELFTSNYRTLGVNTIDEDSNVYQHFLKIPLEGDVLTLPCGYIRTILESFVTYKMDYTKCNSIYVPLYADEVSSPFTFNNSFMSFKWLLSLAPIGVHNLHKFIVRETTYYGRAGMLFDENMQILFMCFAQGRLSDNTFHTDKFIFKVDPKVIIENEDLFSKYIKTKIIPKVLILKESRHILSYRANTSIMETRVYNTTIPVIIEPMRDMVVTSVAPESDFRSSLVNKFLDDNMGSLLDNVKGGLL